MAMRGEIGGIVVHAENSVFYPSINVKALGGRIPFPDADTIKEGLAKDGIAVCDYHAQRIVEWGFEAQAQWFWDNSQLFADDIFPNEVEVFSAGRSNGWLSVDGLGTGDEVSSWGADKRELWAAFEEHVWDEIRTLCVLGNVLDIAVQRSWHEDCHLAKEQHFVGMGGEL